MLISAKVMRCQCCHFVKHRAKVLLDLIAHVDLLFEQVQVVHSAVLGQISHPCRHWIDLIEVVDHNLMDLITQFFLGNAANRLGDILCEGIIDFFFVVVDRGLRVLQVTNVVKHVEGVTQGHQEVIHLVQTVSVSDDLLK